MPNWNRIVYTRLTRSTLFSGVGLSIGFAVPVVVKWAENPASRSRLPLMELGAIITLGVTFIACAVFYWLGNQNAATSETSVVGLAKSTRRLQFGIRSLFVGMTFVAFSIAVAGWLDDSNANIAVVVFVLCVVGWSWFHDWGVRARIGQLLASTFFPFLWMIAYNVPIGHASGLSVNIPVSPALFPSLLLTRWIGSPNFNEMLGMAAVLVCVQLGVGAWLAWRGGKLPVIYAFAILFSSTWASLVFHVLYLM